MKELNIYRQHKNTAARTVTKCRKTDHITPILRQLHWLPVHPPQRSFCHILCQFMEMLLSTPLSSFISTSSLALSDWLQDLSWMFPGQEILRQNDMVSKPSSMLLHLSGMHCLLASGKVIPFSPSKLL